MSQNRFPAFWGSHALPNPIRASPHSKSWKWCDYIDPLLLCNTTICSPSIPRAQDKCAPSETQTAQVIGGCCLSVCGRDCCAKCTGGPNGLEPGVSNSGCKGIRAHFHNVITSFSALFATVRLAVFTVMGRDSTALKRDGWWCLFGHWVGNGAVAAVLSNEAEETAGRPELANVHERGKSSF